MTFESLNLPNYSNNGLQRIEISQAISGREKEWVPTRREVSPGKRFHTVLQDETETQIVMGQWGQDLSLARTAKMCTSLVLYLNSDLTQDPEDQT